MTQHNDNKTTSGLAVDSASAGYAKGDTVKTCRPCQYVGELGIVKSIGEGATQGLARVKWLDGNETTEYVASLSKHNKQLS